MRTNNNHQIKKQVSYYPKIKEYDMNLMRNPWNLETNIESILRKEIEWISGVIDGILKQRQITKDGQKLSKDISSI